MAEMEMPQRIENPTLDDYLAVMSKVVFQSGMSWRMVDTKWPEIREAMDGFKVRTVAGYGPADIDRLAADRRVIRNRRKLEAIAGNAARLLELDAEHGSFQAYLRSHDGFEVLVKDLRRQFKFLGEIGCHYFLFVVGEKVPPHHP
jgi:DNA-3-methyladenine glycosylase I